MADRAVPDEVEGEEGDWRPLRRPPRAPRPPVTGPFARMAKTHAFSAAGDALIAVALAGSLFFAISPDAARERVALYLLLTMAPFAVVAPLIGPWIDGRRGGRRSMVILSTTGRALVCLLLVPAVDGLALFPLAFAALVLGKSYQVARVSMVPGLVRDSSQLVEANAKLTLISGIAGAVAAVPGVALVQLGPPWVLGLAAVVFLLGSVSARRIPATRVAPERTQRREREELRGAGILLAASAMAVLRGVVGFLAFFIAFALRAEDAPVWWFGVVVGTSGVGALVGASLAPPLRRRVREERILLGSLVLVAVGALYALSEGDRAAAAVLAAVVGLAAGSGKLCFDSIVQRDAPDANQGRSFARFETRFQLVWVAGAFVPVVVPVPWTVGYVGIAVACGVASFLYATGRRLSTPDRLRSSVASGTARATQRLRDGRGGRRGSGRRSNHRGRGRSGRRGRASR